MGNVFAGTAEPIKTRPDYIAKPSFDSLEGFVNGRKPRVMQATEQEMMAMKLKPEERDYCAHLLIKLEQCRIVKMPWAYGCSAEKHKWDECEYQDWVLRMKEYERERRLLERKNRKMQAAAA